MVNLPLSFWQENLRLPNCQRTISSKRLSALMAASSGGDPIRTGDLLRARQPLSQLSYTPAVFSRYQSEANAPLSHSWA
jgi:hypothetical protein